MNPFRGEVEITLDGQVQVMRLTLGALAELETSLQVAGLMALVERFETGAFRAADLIALIAAGLTGAGHPTTPAQVAEMDVAGGPVVAARLAAQLLQRTFAVPDAV